MDEVVEMIISFNNEEEMNLHINGLQFMNEIIKKGHDGARINISCNVDKDYKFVIKILIIQH